jgi:hypothetical protein
VPVRDYAGRFVDDASPEQVAKLLASGAATPITGGDGRTKYLKLRWVRGRFANDANATTQRLRDAAGRALGWDKLVEHRGEDPHGHVRAR